MMRTRASTATSEVGRVSPHGPWGAARRRLVILVACSGSVLLPGGAYAGPPKLAPKTIQGMQLNVPVSWDHQARVTNGVAMITLGPRKQAALSPSVAFILMPLQQHGPETAKLFAANMIQQSLTEPRVVRAVTLASGAAGQVVEGRASNTKARLVWASQTLPGAQQALLVVFTGTARTVKDWGDERFLASVAGLRGSAPAASAPPRPKGRFKYPSRYKKAAAPVLSYLVETLHRQPPRVIAHGLRSLRKAGCESLNTRKALAEQLHYFACQADPSVVLHACPGATQPRQSCAQTARSWQQTIELSDGAATPRQCDQCAREAMDTIWVFRCSARPRLMSKAECDGYINNRRRGVESNHRTMMRIINNFGGNSCLCGDPGCSC